MGKFRKIFISSSHRSHGTPTNFRIDLKEDQETGPECHASVRNVCLPNIFFSIMAGVNNKLYVYEQHSPQTGSQNITIEVPEGHYTNTQLANKLKLLLDAATLSGRTWSVDYNAITQRMTFLCNGGTFQIYDDATLKKLGRRNANNGFFDFTDLIPNPQSLQQILNLPAMGNYF